MENGNVNTEVGVSLDIVGIGHIINETIVSPDSKTRFVLGSPPAYSMACAAGLDARVGILTRIGTDYPETLLDPLRQCGVNLEGVVRQGAHSTNNELVYARDGSKTIRYLSRAPEVVPDDLPTSYYQAKLFYICPMDWDTSVESVERFSSLVNLTACDLGGFGGAHSPASEVSQMESDPDAVKRIIGAMHIVKASDEDCRRLTADPELDLEDFARCWIGWGAQVAVVTCGDQGSLVVTRDQVWKIPALPGKPIDPTGGGDSYMGGFLVGYLKSGGEPSTSGWYGAATALLVIEGTGGVTPARMPTTKQVEARLKQGRAQLDHSAEVKDIS